MLGDQLREHRVRCGGRARRPRWRTARRSRGRRAATPSSAAVSRESSATSRRCAAASDARGRPAVYRPLRDRHHRPSTPRRPARARTSRTRSHASAHQDPADDVHEDAGHGDREGDGGERRPAPLRATGSWSNSTCSVATRTPTARPSTSARQGVDRRAAAAPPRAPAAAARPAVTSAPSHGSQVQRDDGGPDREREGTDDDERLAARRPPDRDPARRTATATSVPATVPDTDSTSRVRPSRRSSSLTNASRIAAAKTTGRSRRYGLLGGEVHDGDGPDAAERHDDGRPGPERQARPAPASRARRASARTARRRRSAGRPPRYPATATAAARTAVHDRPGGELHAVPYRPATGVTGGSPGRARRAVGRRAGARRRLSHPGAIPGVTTGSPVRWISAITEPWAQRCSDRAVPLPPLARGEVPGGRSAAAHSSVRGLRPGAPGPRSVVPPRPRAPRRTVGSRGRTGRGHRRARRTTRPGHRPDHLPAAARHRA